MRIFALLASATVAAGVLAGTAAPASANDMAGTIIAGIAGVIIGTAVDESLYHPVRHATGFIPPQQECHYTGYYDQWGRLHTTGQQCAPAYQQPQRWRGDGGHHHWQRGGHMVFVPVVPGPQPIPLNQGHCWWMHGHRVCS